ncbi:MAG: UbiX family flavin prenyltransferase [Peptococcaceae bacterium]|nr:UbiX family flavin prenyltransferase [Peptococcaceae bacterium]
MAEKKDVSRIVVAITGASGSIYGIRLLEELRKAGIETHLILSDWAKQTIQIETMYSVADVAALAVQTYELNNMGALVASGSFLHRGMIVAPCSMKTLAAIANGLENNLIIRAAGVTMKEGRKLLLLPRETPLTAIQLENMLKLSRLGVTIMPPVPALYNKPKDLEAVYCHTVARMLDHFQIENQMTTRWNGG